MNALSLMDADLKALMNVKTAVLVNMPLLKKLTLRAAFMNAEEGIVENAGEFERRKELKELMEEERKRREEEEEKKKKEEERKKREEAERKKREEAERKREEAERKKREEAERKRREEMMALAKTTVSVKCVGDLKNASCYVGVIVIASNCCNDSELSVDLSRFVNLKELKVGNECFENVEEVKLIGLNQLESVVIGKKCFTKKKNDWPRSINPNRHFYLKDCERLKELMIGCYSFSDYSVCEIENVPSLEVIEMGDLNEESCNFYWASLELKSDCE